MGHLRSERWSRFCCKRLPAIFVMAYLAAAPLQARAAGGLDIPAWLDSPGVRLLAVGFYAGGCEACAEAVPEWMRLYDRYHPKGLRLVLVSVPDEDGDCATPEWDPDEVVCDHDGRIAKSLGADCSSPGVFLWSWRGDMLVNKGHVCDVESASEAFLSRNPRVLLQGDQAGLADLLAQELWRAGKLSFPTSVAERDEMARKIEGPGKVELDESVRCDPHEGLSRNGVLRASRSGERFFVRLFSIENACLVTGADVAWAKGKGASEAVGRVMRRLRGVNVQLPGGAGGEGRFAAAPVVDTRPPPSAGGWAPEGPRRVLVRFDSDPRGSIVLVDGDLLCQETPCSREMTQGTVQVTMDKEEYVQRSDQVRLSNRQTLKWKLSPDFGLLAVKTDPPGLMVEVDGEGAGPSPLQNIRLKTGREVRVVVKDSCFEDVAEQVSLSAGQEKTLRIKPTPRPSGIDVSAEDANGNAVAADVTVSGRRLGMTPGLFKIPLCSREVVARHPQLGEARAELDLEERQTRRVRLIMGRSSTSRRAGVPAMPLAVATGGKAGVEWVRIPGGTFRMGSKKGSKDERPPHSVALKAFEIARTETTVMQFRACVAAGACEPTQKGKYCSYHRNDSELHPANCVDWSRAKAFCVWVGGRLPTEAEWEYAARSGGKDKLYPWGGDKATCKKAVMDQYREGCWKERTWPVCSKTGTTEQGLCDMAGNSWEWVADWYDEGYYQTSPVEEPKGPPAGSFKAMRGGAYVSKDKGVRTTGRAYAPPRYASDYYGFRCAR
jgi:formylglycine-generating enzyme required for sulfatase activity